jgi:hypothetical protein
VIAREPKATVELVQPFLETAVPSFEQWLTEGPTDCYPSRSDPQPCKRLIEENERWWRRGRRIWGVTEDGETLGAIGFEPLTARYGFLRAHTFRRHRGTNARLAPFIWRSDTCSSLASKRSTSPSSPTIAGAADCSEISGSRMKVSCAGKRRLRSG